MLYHICVKKDQPGNEAFIECNEFPWQGEAMRWLRERGLASGEFAELFEMGWNAHDQEYQTRDHLGIYFPGSPELEKKPSP